ncbi:PREDICTED: uncharacterized protein LOC104597440 isoform X2 [Nelumbo nucifera]|uniref:Uncharacterized protein LOC104597440 isoform X2 n=1 Tax=Nelumbo nucifera TaxID=4432 RepID=A0A1U8A5Z4_NELNU|nr:PREDICTED: uncharacterized protein LOC104597440 isoform X2 [Nelumbo nucifera]
MDPSQIFVDPDPESKPKDNVKIALEKVNGVFLATRDQQGLRCMSNCEDTTFDIECLLDQHTKVEDEAMDVEVDIIECMNTNANSLDEADDPDATEYSSSFGDTISGTEDNSRLSDAEVESRYCDDNDLASTFFDGLDSLFRKRKKKLTAHWRRYIRPLMWRCKWIELRLKEFQLQALKYDRELAAYDQRKQWELGDNTLEGCGLRSLPFTGQRGSSVMKRRKRKRAEDIIDVPSYMSHHSLFSYYENKKSDVDVASVGDDCGDQVPAADQNNSNEEFGVSYEWRAPEFKDDDPSEQILWNIEVLQSRVQKLKTRIDKVISGNAGKFSSTENLSLLVPGDVPTSSARSPNCSPGNGETMPVGVLYTPTQHMSEYDLGDLVMPESAVSSYGEAAPLPDIFESTMGLLSTTDVAMDQPQIGDSCEDIGDHVLIHNQVTQEDLHNFEVTIQPPEKLQEQVKEEEKESMIPLLPAKEPELASKTSTQDQLTLNSCLASEFQVPKNKRKRGERKASSGSWSHRFNPRLDFSNCSLQV